MIACSDIYHFSSPSWLFFATQIAENRVFDGGCAITSTSRDEEVPYLSAFFYFLDG